MELNEKGIGQALIAPIYYAATADTAYKTELTVVNVRTDAAVKAKVVIRSHKDSVEVLDFVLYLSPADVWRGTIEGTGTTGEAQITSSDDSMRTGDDSSGIGGTGGDESTITQALNTSSTGNLYGSTDSNDWGHIDILGVYTIPIGTYTMNNSRDWAGSGTAVSTIQVKRTMKKAALAALFDDIDDSAASSRNDDFNKCTVESLTVAGTAAAGVYTEVSSISPCALEITGLVTITDGATHRASYTMHAMNAGSPDYPAIGDNFFGGTNAGAGNGSGGAITEGTPGTTGGVTSKIAIDAMLVVANEDYNELKSKNSHLAYNWGLSCSNTDCTTDGGTGNAAGLAAADSSGLDGADSTRSNLQQYDAAIARSVTSWEYDAIATGETSAIVSFPTRYMHRQYTNDNASAQQGITFYNMPCDETNPNTGTNKGEYYSNPFNNDGTVTYAASSYDNSENAKSTPEGDFSGGAVGSDGKFSDEVNYVSHSTVGYYSESTGGWAHIRFTNAATQGNCIQKRFGATVNYHGFPALSLAYKYGASGRMFEKTQDID